MRKLMLAAALIPAIAGCETTQTPTVPTILEASANASVSAASPVQAQQTTFFFCPTVTPFTATIPVVVTAGSVNLFVTSMTSQFTDVNHVQLPMITLPAPIPTAQFGSDLVKARSQVTVPVTVGIGCGTASTGTVVIGVLMTDANGIQSTQHLSVTVR